VAHDGDLIAWTSDFGDGSHALALFNVGDTPLAVKKDFAAFSLNAKSFAVRDVWGGKDLGTLSAVVVVSLAPHASALWVLRR
jgi:hypothetical protein